MGKLYIWNKRLLDLMDIAISEKRVATQREWCEKIGLQNGNLTHIRKGERGFTVEQIYAAGKLMDKSFDWIFNHNPKPLSGIDLIKEGILQLENTVNNTVNKKIIRGSKKI